MKAATSPISLGSAQRPRSVWPANMARTSSAVMPRIFATASARGPQDSVAFGGMGILMLYAVINYIDDHAAKWFIFTGLSLYVIAVMLDFVEGASLPGSTSINFFERFFNQQAHARHTIKVVEEFIEMFGTTCILIGFVRHLFVEFTIKRCMVQNRNINRDVTP